MSLSKRSLYKFKAHRMHRLSRAAAPAACASGSQRAWVKSPKAKGNVCERRRACGEQRTASIFPYMVRVEFSFVTVRIARIRFSPVLFTLNETHRYNNFTRELG